MAHAPVTSWALPTASKVSEVPDDAEKAWLRALINGTDGALDVFNTSGVINPSVGVADPPNEGRQTTDQIQPENTTNDNRLDGFSLSVSRFSDILFCNISMTFRAIRANIRETEKPTDVIRGTARLPILHCYRSGTCDPRQRPCLSRKCPRREARRSRQHRRC